MEANDGRQAQGAYIPQELLKEISKVNNRLLIGIPRERCEAEKRLPLTPEAVDMLTDCGHRVLVESGAGLGINYSDNRRYARRSFPSGSDLEDIASVAGGNRTYETSHDRFLIGAV